MPAAGQSGPGEGKGLLKQPRLSEAEETAGCWIVVLGADDLCQVADYAKFSRSGRRPQREDAWQPSTGVCIISAKMNRIGNAALRVTIQLFLTGGAIWAFPILAMLIINCFRYGFSRMPGESGWSAALFAIQVTFGLIGSLALISSIVVPTRFFASRRVWKIALLGGLGAGLEVVAFSIYALIEELRRPYFSDTWFVAYSTLCPGVVACWNIVRVIRMPNDPSEPTAGVMPVADARGTPTFGERRL